MNTVQLPKIIKCHSQWQGYAAIETVVNSLGINSLFYCKGLNLLDYITDNTTVIAERQRIFQDMLDVPALSVMVDEVLETLDTIAELARFNYNADDNELSLYAIKEVETYVELIDKLMYFVEKVRDKVKSIQLKDFCSAIEAVCISEEHKNLREAVGELTYSVKSVKSITLGINLNASLMPYEAGIVSVNTEPYRAGDLLSKFMRMDFDKTDMHTLAPLEVAGKDLNTSEKIALREAINFALNKILKKSLHGWRKMTKTYFSPGTNPLLALTDDFRFLKKGFEIIQSMKELKIPICFPQISEKEEKQFDAEELYNPITVQALNGQKFIPNNITFDDNGGFYILTGANQGGKTVFLKSVGIAQIMFQLGLPVACRNARISPVEKLLIHLPTSESAKANTSRFSDECERMRQIANQVTEYSLVLLDESFSGSATEESLFIAAEVLLAFAIIGCRGIFSTHMHSLAAEVKGFNNDTEVVSKFDSIVMKSEQGKSTYKLSRCDPIGRSYACTVAEKYGLSTYAILQNYRNDHK